MQRYALRHIWTFLKKVIVTLFIIKAVLVAVKGLTLLTAAHAADPVQRVVSPGGIPAWLVENHRLPIMTMDVGFHGGRSQDPGDKPGVADFFDYLEQGAGDMDTQQLWHAARRLGLSTGSNAYDDMHTMTLTTLTKHRQAAFELLRLMIEEPRVEDDAIARTRQRLLTSLEAKRKDPAAISHREWLRSLFPARHHYSRAAGGTVNSVKAITREDLEAYRRAVFARDNLSIAVVGDIDAPTLGCLLDRTFGGLPARARLSPVTDAPASRPLRKHITMDVAQTHVVLGYVLDTNLQNHDMPARDILNHILGSDALSSRLNTELRVKRGLVYGVTFLVARSLYADFVHGSFATDPGSVDEALAIVRRELKKMAEQGPTAQEIEDAKAYLKGVTLVGYDTSAALAAGLRNLQHSGYPPDSLETYPTRVDAVTPEELRRLAKKVLRPEALTVITVGRP